jgi:hypothetical protein
MHQVGCRVTAVFSAAGASYRDNLVRSLLGTTADEPLVLSTQFHRCTI